MVAGALVLQACTPVTVDDSSGAPLQTPAADASPPVCRSDASPASPRSMLGWHSGDRLRAERFSFDSVPVLSHWYDTVRGEACAFEYSVPEGQVRRCLPIEDVGGFGWPRYFKDAQCSVELATADACGHKYVRSAPRNACDSMGHVYRPKGLVDGKTAYTLIDDGTHCIPTTAQVEVPEAFCEVGEELPRTEFVAAQESVEPRQGGVDAWVLVGEDGSREVRGAYDSCHHWPARASTETEDGLLRFVPLRIAFDYSSLWGFSHGGAVSSEPTCHRPAAVKDADTAICPVDAVLSYLEDDQSCDPMKERWLHARERLTTISYPDEQNVCRQMDVPAGSGELYFTFDDYMPPEEFTRARETIIGETGVAPIFLTADVDGAEPLTRSSRWYDHEHQTQCTPWTLADGSIRCLPGSFSSYAFADAQCTRPVISLSQPPCETTLAPPKRVMSLGLSVDFHPESFGQQEVLVFDVGPEWTERPLYGRDYMTGACVSSEPRSETFYEVGPVVDLSKYPVGHVDRE